MNNLITFSTFCERWLWCSHRKHFTPAELTSSVPSHWIPMLKGIHNVAALDFTSTSRVSCRECCKPPQRFRSVNVDASWYVCWTLIHVGFSVSVLSRSVAQPLWKSLSQCMLQRPLWMLLWLRPWTSNVTNFGNVADLSDMALRCPLPGNAARHRDLEKVPIATDFRSLILTFSFNSCALVNYTFDLVQCAC